ncbi:MAG TPA: TIGR03943 family protein [Streptosporangiaceae bacterium]
MSEDARATTVLLVGALLVRLSIGGAYARYVRVGMGPWLLVAGLLLVALGLAGVIRALAAKRPAADPHGDHEHGERVGWLLLAPVLALLLVTPPALGSYGVDRNASVKVTAGDKTFDPLPAGRTAPMTLLEFDERAADHHGASMGSTPVRLTGFVARTNDNGGFRLARYQIACCAADAVAAVARVTGAIGDQPARDRWVTVTGTYRRSADGVPELQASSLTEIPPPADPYE